MAADTRMALLEAGYAALSRGDFPAWVEQFDHDVELHELPQIPGTEVYRGRDEVVRWARQAYELVDSWDWTIEEVLYRGSDVLVLRVQLEARGKASSAPITTPVFHFLRFRGDTPVEVRGFLDQDPALALAGEAGDA